jgi:rubrerythrin
MNVVPTNIAGFSGDPTGAAAIFAGDTSADNLQNQTGLVVQRLNSLLRGEIAAAETYRNVLDHIANGENADLTGALREVQRAHATNAQSLRDRLRELGGEADDDSGAWGAWAQVVQGTLTFFGGDRGGLRALREGEQHGINDYETALNEVDPTSAQLIENQLLPGQRKHLVMLDRLLNGVSDAAVSHEK